MIVWVLTLVLLFAALLALVLVAADAMGLFE